MAELVIAVARSAVDPRGRARVDQDPEMEAARLKAVHEARVKIVPRV